jgi:lipopolysaccharide exporter
MNEESRSREVTASRTQHGGSALRRMAVGSAWMIAARWSVRCIGLVSTIILARLLRPEDFGLVAMGAVTVQFVLVFADAGQAFAVIRNADATSEHFDTAWTMSVCAGVAVALILIGMGPLAGAYFHDERAVAVVQFLALKPLINGFTNVGILAFRKDLRFGKDFQFLVAQKVSVFIATVTLALMLRSYWALAIGNVCGEVINVLVSYRMHPYRPRLRLTKLKEIWTYSLWMQFASIANFFGEQADQVIVGGLAGARAMGVYNVSADVASAPTNELVVPVARALFPVYATLLSQPARLADSYLTVLSAVAVIALSTGIGVALVADDLVAVVLGPQWLATAPLVAWLAVGSAILGVGRSANTVLSVTGNGRIFAVRNWIFVALLVPAAIIGGMFWGSVGVAEARAIVTVLFAPVMFYSVMRIIPISTVQIIERLWRPAIAALCMAAAVKLSGSEAITLVPLRLLFNVGLGAATFTVSLFSLWLLSGRPHGAERILAGQAMRLLGRLSGPAGLLRR